MVVALAVAIPVLAHGVARACPFCSAASQTFSEEMAAMDVAAIAQLVSSASPAPDAGDPTADISKSKFVIREIIKGEKWVQPGAVIETLYFGDVAADKPFLIMGTDAPNVMWSTPLILSERGREYLKKLGGLPKDHRRLAFFQEYLEDADEMLARDAYDEFAKAPYEDVIALKAGMHRDQLLEWINDAQVPSNRRRLYFTMLGVCGIPEDAELLESLMKSPDRKQRAGLDALIACHLLLRKQEGLNLVDELFLENRDAEYADTYAAIMAIRFHGSQVDVIPKQRLVESLRLMLDRPELADLVIPDLAKWEDWEVMPRLVKLFRDADENSSWVRVPVINYLRVCPRPEAKQYIEELAKIDPEAVKRANTFFPLGAESSGDSAGQDATVDAAAQAPAQPQPDAGGK
jgi:hypothetical protein